MMMLAQDEDDSPFMSQSQSYKTVRNTHSMPSDSEDEQENAIFLPTNHKPLHA